MCPRPLQVVTWTASHSFQVGGRRARCWCESSYTYSNSVPIYRISIYLPVPKTRAIFGRGIKWPGDLCEQYCLPLNGVKGHPFHRLPSCQFSASYALPFSTKVRHGTDRRTDRQTTTAINAYCWPEHLGYSTRDQPNWADPPNSLHTDSHLFGSCAFGPCYRCY